LVRKAGVVAVTVMRNVRSLVASEGSLAVSMASREEMGRSRLEESEESSQRSVLDGLGAGPEGALVTEAVTVPERPMMVREYQ
jgi:hypothetical protein